MRNVDDRHGRLNELRPGCGALLELGCGPNKRNPESIGIDLLDVPGADVIGNATDVLRLMPTGSARMISSWHFLEHVDDLGTLLREAMRVLEIGGRFVATVPHFSNAFFYSDPTHRNFFGLYTFSYFFEDRIFTRRVPNYARLDHGRLSRVRMEFRSSRPHYVSHAIRRAVGAIVNSSNMLMEIYEESFSSWISCYEITYEVTRIDP